MGDQRPTDLRSNRRIDVKLQVKLRFADVERFRLFSTKDLSTGGIFVVTDTPKEKGSAVQVVLYPPGIELGLPLYGTVVHALDANQAAAANARPGMGIRFDELDDEARSSLAALIENVGDAIEGKPPKLDLPLPGLGAADEPEELALDDLIEEEGEPAAEAQTVEVADTRAATPPARAAATVSARTTRGPIVPPPPSFAYSPGQSAGDDERRIDTRLATRSAVRLRFADAEGFREFQTKDVSRGGAFVCANPPLPIGTEVELFLSVGNGAEMTLEGRVARVVEPGPGVSEQNAGMGIEFTNLTLEKRAEINRYVDELAGKAGAEKLGRVRVVSSAIVRFESAMEFQRIVRGDLRHRRIFVATDEPRPVGTTLTIHLQAPQLPDGMQLQGEVQKCIERGDTTSAGPSGNVVTLLDLTDELLADLDLRTRPTQTVSSVAANKAAKLAEAAQDDLAAGRRASAIANLKLALSFDPHNDAYRKLLAEFTAQGSAVKGGAPGKR
jgi:uncharacterized protein (TIGR02266 family)